MKPKIEFSGAPKGHKLVRIETPSNKANPKITLSKPKIEVVAEKKEVKLAKIPEKMVILPCLENLRMLDVYSKYFNEDELSINSREDEDKKHALLAHNIMQSTYLEIVDQKFQILEIEIYASHDPYLDLKVNRADERLCSPNNVLLNLAPSFKYLAISIGKENKPACFVITAIKPLATNCEQDEKPAIKNASKIQTPSKRISKEAINKHLGVIEGEYEIASLTYDILEKSGFFVGEDKKIDKHVGLMSLNINAPYIKEHSVCLRAPRVGLSMQNLKFSKEIFEQACKYIMKPVRYSCCPSLILRMPYMYVYQANFENVGKQKIIENMDIHIEQYNVWVKTILSTSDVKDVNYFLIDGLNWLDGKLATQAFKYFSGFC